MIAVRRRRRRFAAAVAVLAALAAVAPTTSARVTETSDRPATIAPTALAGGQLTAVRVVGGFSSPLGVTNAGDGSGRLFVVQQNGRVRMVSGGRITGTFLDLSSRTAPGGERGLLGIAFHPDFASNRFVYAYYTRPGGDIRISRYTANSARTFASLTTEVHILDIPHGQYSNHNGGAMAFGPDGYLYIGTGDGGGSGDPLENAQDITNELLGKILRIAPSTGPTGGYAIPADNPFAGPTTGDDEIWDYGVRNPWRISFDRTTGNLFIGDVGQGRREEVNREIASDPGGNNFGWDVLEGTLCFEPSSGCPTPPNYKAPVATYSHTYGCSITGGYVYRGSHRDLQGLYVYSDYCSGRLWTMNENGTGETIRRDTSLNVSSFGESETGELYLTDIGGGALYRVIAPEFSDIATSTFLDHIHWIYYEGITTGCGGGRFCPRTNVTRAQMAIFLVRAFDIPPATGPDHFTDDNGITGESAINALYEAGITGGCTPTRFCPTASVRRSHMALFLDRAIEPPLPPTAVDYFDDDDGKTGESAINRLAEAGVTGGCASRRFCPNEYVTREQMSAFLRRAVSLP
jgi:glucose/arabinose dehydrogenase